MFHPWRIFRKRYKIYEPRNVSSANKFLSSADFFSKLTFFENYFRNTIGLPNSLGLNQRLFTKGNQQTTPVAIEIMIVFFITRHAYS